MGALCVCRRSLLDTPALSSGFHPFFRQVNGWQSNLGGEDIFTKLLQGYAKVLQEVVGATVQYTEPKSSKLASS